MTKYAFRKFKKVSSNFTGVKLAAPFLLVNRKKLFLIILPLAFSIAFRLYITNSVVGEGQELARTESQMESVLRQNRILSEEIARVNSLGRLESQAEVLGLAKPKNVKYIEADVQIGKSSQNFAFRPDAGNQ